MSVDYLRRAENYFEQARALSGSCNKALLIWLAALAYIWLTGIEPLQADLMHLSRLQAERVGADAQLASERQQLLDRYSITSGLDLEEIGNKTAYDEDAKASLAAARELISKRQGQVEAEKSSVEFELPGMKLPVVRRYAPVFWMGLLLLLFMYVAFARRRVLHLCSKGLRMARLGQGDGRLDCSDLLCEMPAWLAPLPTRDGAIPCEWLRSALGWQRSYRHKLLLVSVIAILLLLVQLRVGYIARNAAILFPAGQRSQVLVVAGALCGALLIVWLFWRHPLCLPDHFPEEPSNVASSRSAKRRCVPSFCKCFLSCMENRRGASEKKHQKAAVSQTGC